MDLTERLAVVLAEILPVTREDDGALTVQHEQTFASLRVVTIAEGLDLVSLTQVLAWDLPLDSRIRAQVAKHAHDTLLGTVSLVEKVGTTHKGTAKSKKTGDVLLRYNFPAAGLTDDALRTLVLMVLATGTDVRNAMVG
ncbi:MULTISPECIES: hypothetical protein [Mycolicibacterium]|uniref:Uncharacterized protein n=3 Tax=Mycolicibacterium gilvum TaxID=1804 RepID=E6TEM4_MYCSR|nr:MULTISPECIES: hypothetical protein [Mycolicibacterium]ABP45192.1 conserved hypothetical protein [Mycolicibacterium gilvum PYR-GCK]ADT98806.1 hypothetical protein Mspyr1_21520 [Mycolicibacterium gilvum Spyr1]MBV5243226.1 hypothetical protein [Mycolicibacterium sp. PAM1]MCV7054981.1 hypothetical protein [Mycolicibacterium gilvum]STZ44494.1 Uncharacterised protein [Mycolicibacterium gilvum]